MKKFLLFVFIAGFSINLFAQSNQYPPLVTFTTAEDHANMMEQLGIKAVRPGPSGNESDPDHANYDESIANPCPILPDILTTNDGRAVTTPEMWWNVRRPEIVEGFEREVYGRLPENIPEVTWTVEITDNEYVGRTPVVAKKLVGHVDNSDYPLIDVNIDMMVVLPQNVEGPVPVLMMFGRPSFPAPAQPSEADAKLINEAFREALIKNNQDIKEVLDRYPAWEPFEGANPFAAMMRRNTNTPPSSTEQLLAAGWGYATINPGSIQADNGAGLTRGIIGLVNKGQPRTPEDWGSLRAWAWGAARGLDYLETDPMVDAKKVGIEGVSRYGKAAFVTLAFEDRFAMALIGSSGKGGVTLHRRVFGEAVESLTGAGEYHWMAGNYIKYGASDATFGSKTGCDIPVDSHQLLAMCAPRLAFVSYGIPEQGDAKWLDQKGSYMSTIAAGAAYKLLGAKDLGVSNDYLKEEMPPVLTGLLDGHLAWRQHDGGHTDGPNYEFFIPWASKLMGYTSTPLRR